jgi:hypothetical protein
VRRAVAPREVDLEQAEGWRLLLLLLVLLLQDGEHLWRDGLVGVLVWLEVVQDEEHRPKGRGRERDMRSRMPLPDLTDTSIMPPNAL